MAESTQHKLDRIRYPRVHITYDLEAGEAIQTRELPFVLGILADLSGVEDPKKKLKDRKFVEIDSTCFDQVMQAIAPKVNMYVSNVIEAKGKTMNLKLSFSKMDDLKPVSIIKQIEPLRKLYESRTKLNDLLAKMDGNEDLEEMLTGILTDEAIRKSIKGEVDKAAPSSPAASAKKTEA